MSKKIAISKIVEWAKFRKSIGAKSVKRVECVSVGEAHILSRIVLEQEDMQEIARQTGGAYEVSTGGNSKIVF